jgi:hypothetical protein
VAVVCQQLHAKAVNCAEESTVECSLNFGRAMLGKNALSRPLLHLVGGAMSKGNDNEFWQDFESVSGSSKMDDPLGDGVGLARAGSGDHREIAVEFFGESLPS